MLYRHIHISIVVDDCADGTLAYASSCYFDDANYRPLAGFTNICPQVCALFLYCMYVCISIY